MPAPKDEAQQRSAKRYASCGYALRIVSTLYQLTILFLFLATGASAQLARALSHTLPFSFLALGAYVSIVYAGYSLLILPLHFYGSFVLEHTFSLSRQSAIAWGKDELKVGLIAFVITLLLAAVFFTSVRVFLHAWWLVISLFWISFSIVMARLLPTVLIPLFFKYRDLSDLLLKERIIRLADTMKVALLDCLEIDLSKKTVKANAAFVGWGKSRRVLLADTLNARYSHDEIEVILAHEFAHYKLQHILKLILLNAVLVLASFYLMYITQDTALHFFNLRSLWDIAALPVVALYFVLIGIIIEPLVNILSRRFEREADALALKVTGLSGAFIVMMEKLAKQNLADTNPHPLIKVFFFDHPPIAERIAFAKRYIARSS